MTEREKAIAAVECCFHLGSKGCRSCPYVSEVDLERGCTVDLAGRIIAQLKTPEARILDWNEIGTVDGAVWLEDRDKSEVVPGLVMQMHSAVNLDIKKDGKLRTASASCSDYGYRWRAWSARPTEEQMRETKWEESDAE